MASKLGQKRPRTPLVVPSRRYCRGNDPSSLLNCYNIIFQLGTFKTSSLFQTCCSVAQPQRIVLLCVSLKSRGIPAYPRFGLREHFAFRHFLFSGLFLLSWLYFSIFFSVPRAAQWNWDGSNNCYFLHRSVVPASGPEGRKEEGGIGERQTCTGRISVTRSEQINSATTNEGEEEKERKMGKINKTDGRLFEPNNQGALRQPDYLSVLRTPLTFSTTSHRVRRTSRATSMPGG